MIQTISDKSSEELMLLYHQINKELTVHLLKGDAWDEQQERITALTEISKELTRRKIELNRDDQNPKFSPQRN